MANELDLTAVFVPAAGLDADAVRRLVHAGGYDDVWLRVHPLSAVGLVQIELFDEHGAPRVDPALVSALSSENGRATFVHLNRSAGQAMIHAFAGGKELEGWVGTPDDLDLRVKKALGHSLDAIAAADDGSRIHPSVASSDMVALVRGRALKVRPGMPIALGSFSFHDRHAQTSAATTTTNETTNDVGGDRLALLAFDAAALRHAWTSMPGVELAARVKTIADAQLGPLKPTRDSVVAELAAIGDAHPDAARLHSVRALELLLLSETCFYAGGDEATFFDERLLPMFSLTTGDPPLDDPDEALELESRKSVLEAMVEVLPFRSPEGSMLEQLDDAEISPLPPWVKPGEESVGSIFLLDATRLRTLLSSLDHRDLAARVDRFYRSWWKAQTDDRLDEKFETWRRDFDQRGADDVHRFLSHWTEWRMVLDLAAENQLDLALLFYSSV